MLITTEFFEERDVSCYPEESVMCAGGALVGGCESADTVGIMVGVQSQLDKLTVQLCRETVDGD